MSSTDSELTLFDRVHDKDDPDGILVVAEVTHTPANEFELTGGVTVADVHDSYPPTDQVVVVAYDRDLDRNDPHWRRRGGPITDMLNGQTVTLHYYPESKLELYRAGNFTDGDDGTLCEHCSTTLETPTDWVSHVVRDCPHC